jgi:hypothetical protein
MIGFFQKPNLNLSEAQLFLWQFSNSQFGREWVGVEQIVSSDSIRGTGAGCSHCACDDCAGILHGLNNVLASMLLNAQVMEWKLPSYSRSRRYLHEIERNAQRGGELVKRLLGQLEAKYPTVLSDGQVCLETPALAGADSAVVAQEPDAATGADGVRMEAARDPAAVFRPRRE